MRGRTKLVSLATVIMILLSASMVFASGVVDVSKISLLGAEPMSPGTTVFVDPSVIIKDYYNDPGYQIGNTFLVHVNISEVTNLFSYQVNVTWSPAMLNFTGVWAYGDFLARTGSSYGTSRIEKIYIASNVTGYASIAETILGDVPGITGNGRLFTIQFKVVGYGSTMINIGVAGTLPTTLLDSTEPPSSIAFTTASCYFRNALRGDVNFDRTVDVSDLLKVVSCRSGPPPGPGGYQRDVDINYDTFIDISDLLIVVANRGRTVPP